MPDIEALLVLPRLRVQNANAISSPMTWGFPSMTAFIGLMHALERKLPEHIDLQFNAVGVICHAFEPQVSRSGYTRAFHLTRNPVGKDGKTAAIVEEGRVHLEITLIFAVEGAASTAEADARAAMAQELAGLVATMRIAGGSVVPAQAGRSTPQRPELTPLNEDAEGREEQFRGMRRRWLPGFALVSRDDLLQSRLAELRQEDSTVTALDAWLSLTRLEFRPEQATGGDASNGEVRWQVRRTPGWTVPIAIGYGALSPLYPPGHVANARDAQTPFRFVESLYSIGEWKSPHRLRTAGDLVWYPHSEASAGLYRCRNDYRPAASADE
ncbi:type I-F CRISPR-associated protein Csy2 [Alkalilimnicola sp. S0819]|uniref:type I-F CRISPR-associated protein Csy2 n=1 Tax=Alkalilimnicola sp. S0819 TaxID=2613922 RepID=UPI001261F954|nr:type I-F CRISPR-associated protein Csy2 [Alkalilimnicola sp. S0819]KAB7624020.1 type I-F CRISPR-associated protein Csy2 [Alkalilimnicola sp. S0819]MPQ16628.1 type I-F CRISPR-associated protein Csy2 [Alkalilimnicola sp. S0819]